MEDSLRITACLVLLCGAAALSSLSPCQEPPQAAKDVLYTATVTGQEARFVFPLQQCPEWRFGGPAPQETAEYEWSVQMDNAGTLYKLGVFVAKGPGQVEHVSRQAPAFYGQNQVFAISSSGEATLLPTLPVLAQPGGLPETQDYNRLVLTITDPAALRLLFYGRPKSALFTEKYPDQPPITHEVEISYGDYSYKAPPPKLVPAWSRSFSNNDARVPNMNAASAALSYDGGCSAVAIGGAVYVLDSAGKTLWRWDYAKANRLITPGPLAVSSACDAVAMAGNSSYKYTWIANRDGPRTPIQTANTPLGLGFSRDGKLVVLGTGGGDLLLLSSSGELKWKKVLTQWYPLYGELSFSRDDKFILLLGRAGVVSVDGTPVWNSIGDGMQAARDVKTFVSWWAPPHGHPLGRITALDAEGKELWTKSAPGDRAAMSAFGDKIAALVYSKQEMTQEEADNVEDQDVELDIFSRSGEILKSPTNEYVHPVAMSPAGDRLLVCTRFGLQEWDIDGKPFFEIPGAQCLVGSNVFLAEDFAGVLTFDQAGQLAWYTLK